MSLTQIPYIDRSGQKKMLDAAAFNFTDDAFNAFDKLFKHLDKIFRGKGNSYIPQKHSSTADHSAGVMNLADDFVFSKLPKYLQDIVPKIRAGILMHDFGELPGEISTMFQRLNKEEKGMSGIPISEDSRRKLEAKVVSLLLYKALEAVYIDDDNFFSSEFEVLQTSMNLEQNQYERFRMVESFINSHENELVNLNGEDQRVNVPGSIPEDRKKQFTKDFYSLLDAYKISIDPCLTQEETIPANHKSIPPLLWSLIKFFDKAEAEVYVSDVAIIDDNKKDFIEFLDKPSRILNSIKESVRDSVNFFEKNIAAKIEELLDNVRSVYVAKQRNADLANSQP